MNSLNNVKGGVITCFANKDLYSKNSIFKCIYWYGGQFECIVDNEGKDYKITLKPLSAEVQTEDKLKETLIKLERDLIDFNLRDIVTNETKNIRDLINAKAFSHGEFDEEPPGEVSDPVGFKPSEI